MSDKQINSVIKLSLPKVFRKDADMKKQAEQVFSSLKSRPNMTGVFRDSASGPVVMIREVLALDEGSTDEERIEAAKASADQLYLACQVKWELITELGELIEESEFIAHSPAT